MRRPGMRLILGGLAALGIVGAGALAIGGSNRSPDPRPRAASDRPVLLLVTTLPLVFPEEFTLRGGGSKALSALETRYAVVPIGTTDARSLRQGRLLLLAHPLAQPAENLVALDEWVRAGGRLLLLADPLLEWPSDHPLGDPRRAPIAFADTGLLRHWGLRLDAPDERGPRQSALGGERILTASPGTIVRVGGACAVADAGLAATCDLGQGRAVIVADADFLNLGPDGLDGPADGNLAALVSQLARLSR